MSPIKNLSEAIDRRIRRLRAEVLKLARSKGSLSWIVAIDRESRRKEYEDRFKKIPIDEKSIFFESFSGDAYGCSPKAIYQELCDDSYFEGWHFVWSFKVKGQPLLDEAPELGRATIVRPGSKAYYDAIASSKYWIRNNRIAEFVTKRPEQIYIQTWHGTPLKALGYDTGEVKNGSFASGAELARQNSEDAKKWDYLVSPSEFTSQKLASAYRISQERLSNILVQVGYPRNDVLASTGAAQTNRIKIVTDLRRRLMLPEAKRILLYAPTWRDDQKNADGGYYFNLDLDLGAMRDALGNEWIVLVRMHSLVRSRFAFDEWEGFAYDASDIGDIGNLYCIADALCTDYSSVFFDYANTGRPIFFFWTDIERYRQELHDFYIDPDTLPGPKCASTSELIEEISHYEDWDEKYGPEYALFRSKYCYLDDGRAAARVIERCIEK